MESPIFFNNPPLFDIEFPRAHSTQMHIVKKPQNHLFELSTFCEYLPIGIAKNVELYEQL